MSITLAFDVYGTLIDTHGMVSRLQQLVGDQARAFSQTWRDKQLEYSFRRGLMANYQTFAVCTGQALDYTCSYHRADLTAEQKQSLLDSYRTLPAFADAQAALTRLQADGYRMFAFSNGSADAVENLLSTAGLHDFFHGIVSVDEVKSFKPNPAVYSHFLRQSGAYGGQAWLISGNPFDVIGAISAGMRAAWVRRSPDTVYDPWEIEPTLTVAGLVELQEKFETWTEAGHTG